MLTKFLREAFLGLNLCGYVISQRVCKFSATRQPREAIFRVNLWSTKRNESFEENLLHGRKIKILGIFVFFCPFWRFLDAFSGYFQAKNTFFRGHFAFLNGMQEKQNGKNNEKSKEKAVGRGSDIFSDSFHSALKKPSFFRRKASSWRCSECICCLNRERKTRSHLPLSKWCYLKFAHEFCENHLPSFVKKDKYFSLH